MPATTKCPVCRGTERRDFLFFKADAEVILGRFAMMGIVGLFWIPFVNVSNVGHPAAGNLHHFCFLLPDLHFFGFVLSARIACLSILNSHTRYHIAMYMPFFSMLAWANIEHVAAASQMC